MLIKNFVAYEKTENGYCIHAEHADVLLVFMRADIIRIRVSFEREFREASYALVRTAWEDRLDSLLAAERQRIQALDIACEETETQLRFNTGLLTLVMNKAPLWFSLYDRQGKLLYRDLRERAFERDQLGRLSHYSCMDRERDHFYGFGEKTGRLDKKGRRLRMSPKDAIGHDPECGDPMYKHIPFYIRVREDSLRPLGFFYNNSHDCIFDMGQEISGYWERYCYYQTEGGDIDLFLMAGETMKEIIGAYTWLTGTTCLPTKQSLGYCASTMYYAELEKDCDQEIYKVMDQHRALGIPIDNFWLASGYSSGEQDNLRYTFNWNKKRFPDPEGFFRNMEARGINVICNLKPGVLKHHPYAAYYEARKAFIRTAEGDEDYYGRWWGGEGRFIDFTGKAGREAWKQLLIETILSKGEKTVWNDNCEMDGVEDREARCDFEGAGGTMAELKIIHSNMMAYVAREALAEVYPEERPYVINRAGYAGIQRYAQVWGGDNLTSWNTLRYNINTILGMGLSGCANMGCDIGGFAGPAPEAELLLRWIQNAIFQPRFVINSANSDNTVTQPFMYEENIPQVKAAFLLRYRLLPYLYSLMYEAYTKGTPAMRPLFLEFPEDKNCYQDEHLSFMFGPSLLVANVLEPGASERTLYLPAGCSWYALGDELREYAGGQTITIPVDKDSIPMFLRGDGIVLFTEDIYSIVRDSMKTLKLLVSAQKDTSFIWYEDDGHSRDYEKGIYAATELSVESGECCRIKFTQRGAYAHSVEQLELRLVSKEKGAYWCSVDGRKLPGFVIRENWEAAEEGWYYHMADRTIWLKCKMPKKPSFELCLSREKFDLIGMTED